MKLYDMKMAPNPRRVRIFLAEKGISDFDRVEIDISEGENLREEFLKINPRGQIPTLVLDDGTCLDESVAICRYLEETCPEPNLMGVDPLQKAKIEAAQRHMEFDGMLALVEAFRNSAPFFAERAYPGLPAGYPAIPELAERGKKRFLVFLDALETRLSGQAYVAGDIFSIADITALCTIDFARVVKIRPTQAHVNVRRWHEAVSSRPSAAA